MSLNQPGHCTPLVTLLTTSHHHPSSTRTGLHLAVAFVTFVIISVNLWPSWLTLISPYVKHFARPIIASSRAPYLAHSLPTPSQMSQAHASMPSQSSVQDRRTIKTRLRNQVDGGLDPLPNDTLQPQVQTYLAFNTAVLLAGGFLAFTTSSILNDMVAGALASFCTMLIGYPLDTAKTRLQIGQNTMNEDGIFGLYKGITIGLLREATTAAIYLATCGFLKIYLVPADAAANLETLGIFLFIGAAACLASCTTRVPLEIVSKQIQSGQCQTISEAARKVFYGPDGCSTVERSWIAVMLREVPYGAFQIAFFELAKLMFTFLADWQVPIFLQRMAWGAVAGSGAAFLTTPFDVITSRIMISKPDVEGEGDAAKKSSVLQTIQKLYQEEGPSVFFTGSLLRALFYAPGTCLFFTVYETVVAALK